MQRPYRWNDVTKHGFYRFLAEIDECLQYRQLLPALCCSLMIPDICGKVLYPDKNTGVRYVLWYDEFQGRYDVCSANDVHILEAFDAYLAEVKRTGNLKKYWPTDFKEHAFYGIPGQAVYKLRCSLLHSGRQEPDKYDGRYSFSFTAGPVNFEGTWQFMDVIEEFSDGEIRCHINIDRFCKCLLRNVLSFFLAHFDDFEDVSMNVTDMDVALISIIDNGRSKSGMLHRCVTVFDEDEDLKAYFSQFREEGGNA